MSNFQPIMDAPGAPGGPPPFPAVASLPPQMFTTAASLLDLTDKKLIVTLRDGTKYYGVLRSWDQFGNLVLSDTTQRIYAVIPSDSNIPPQTVITGSVPDPAARHLFADMRKGTMLVRGENIVLLGEVDLDRDDDTPAPWQRGDEGEVFEAHQAATKARQGAFKTERNSLRAKDGFEGENNGEVLV